MASRKSSIFEQNKIPLRLFAYIFIAFFVVTGFGFAQEKTQILIPHGGSFTKNEEKYPGASIFSKDTRQVQFQHEGADLFCDMAVFYEKENRVRAFGNVRFNQGDTLQMRSGYIEYSGNTKLAVARNNVTLTNPDMTLTTDTLHFDRNQQQAYYNSFGTIRDSVNTLTSNKGRYFTQTKKYQFISDVNITNPDYTLNSARLDYYTVTKHAYMYGPSTITGKDYVAYCERGYYDTQNEKGYFIKNSRIDYSHRQIFGDSLYFEKATEFASATNNIKIIDTVNNGVIRGHYGEVYKAKDSAVITKRAVAINVIEKDSMYVHADKLMVTGKPEHRVLRAFNNARIFKSDLSGRCDSIHSDQKTGITQLISKIPAGTNERNAGKFQPILWSGENQITGDSIHLVSNVEEERLDSIKVLNRTFIVQKDTIGDNKYNQIKGKYLYGQFIDNELKYIDIEKNTEVIYYMYNDENELVGINKTIPSAINLTLSENQIEEIIFYKNVDGDIFPESELPENSRKLLGFIWRGDERLKSKEDLFDEDDNNIQLVKIRGIDNPIDIEAEEEEHQKKLPQQQKPKQPNKATLRKPTAKQQNKTTQQKQ